MLRTASLVASSIARRCFLAHASSHASAMPQIKVALCIQRYASLSPEMKPLEKEYSNLLERLETDNSYLSDHELRHKTEIELTKQRQSSPTSTAGLANVVETAVDLEDRLAKEFESFQFMSRETEDDKANNIRSHNRKLDQNLLLVVQQASAKSDKDEWIFPEKTFSGEPSLRAAVEKVVPQCGNLVVQIAGNAPWACYKNEADPSSKKIFFYKGEYLAGVVKQFSTGKSASYKDHAWITHDDLPKYLSPTYYEAVKDMLFVF